MATSAYRAALNFTDRALVLQPDANRMRVAMLIQAGGSLTGLGELTEAHNRLEDGLSLACKLGDAESAAFVQGRLSYIGVPLVLDFLAGLANVLAHTGQPEPAIELLGVALYHPALVDETRQGHVAPLLADLGAQFPEAVVEAGLARGRVRELDEVVTELTRLPKPRPGAVE